MRSLPGRVVALPLLLLALVVPAVRPAGIADAAAPSGFSQTTIVSGLASPTAMAFAPDGRLFVATQAGSLRVVKDGVLLSTPFLTVPVNATGERGLLGVAFDPAFATNRYVYVYYTATTPQIHNRVSRFTADGDVALAGSERILLELDPLGASNHNGGALHFGPDGKLYVAVGDNATGSNSQSLANLLGKILRIGSDGSIPSDNPFHGTATGVNRAIWALGLRNPYTFAFRPGTGRMFINDVGQTTWEEIDDGTAGANYGWPESEGPTTIAGYTSPVHWYGHGTGSTTLGCAITGGAFYVPTTPRFPDSYVGSYFFADYCGGWINRIDPANAYAVTTFATGIVAPVDLVVGPDGALYYLARGGGSSTGVVGRIAYTATDAPTILEQPASTTVSVGRPATFRVSAAGGLPLSYRWQRNGVDISGATSATYTLGTTSLADSGAVFRAIVSNAVGSVTSGDAVLTVVANTAPVASITTPTAGATYAGGDVIAFSGAATDVEETLGPGRFAWTVVFHHDTHDHGVLAAFSGTSGSFTVPRTGETSTGVWYELSLTVTDSGGLAHTVSRRIDPRVATLTLATSPSGLATTVDGQPCASPCAFGSVVGMQRQIGVTSPQTLAGTSYAFSAWSDRGKATHAIVTPSTATTYTATFKVQKRR